MPEAIRQAGGFLFRPARPEDKEQVLAFTANTWEHGDYIKWVYDEWLVEESGCFLVAIDEATGKIAGIDKLRMLSPREAWFEGIRVNPEFRGRGLSGLLQRRMLEEARARGARTVRFLTALDNLPIHRIAYRDGFSMRFSVRHWKWEAGKDAITQIETPVFREARSEEAQRLHDWWQQSGSFHAAGGLLDRGWVFSETSGGEWMGLAAEGRILVPEGTQVEDLVLPPPLFIVGEEDGGEGDIRPWRLSLVAAGTEDEWTEVAGAILQVAAARGVQRIDGLLPDIVPLFLAFEKAGFTRGEWTSFALFERNLGSISG